MNTLFRATLFLACIPVINLVSSIGSPAKADAVTDWNNAALDAIRAGNTAPPIASRSLAILHASIYDAVNGIARTHEPYLVQSAVSASASREAAGSAAAHDALVNLFPANASTFDALHAAILAAIPDSPQKTAGIVWGEFVANQILAARANDGSNASNTRRTTMRLRNSARLSVRRAQRSRPRSPCSGPTAPAPKRLPATGTALPRLSPPHKATHWKKTQGYLLS